MLSDEVKSRLSCPACGQKLLWKDTLACGGCHTVYPVISGVPILVCPEKSIIAVRELHSAPVAPPGGGAYYKSKLKSLLKPLIPTIGKNIAGAKNYKKLACLLSEQSSAPRVLIIGSGDGGEGTQALLSCPNIELVETDVYFGSCVEIICDAHDLPFEAETFDGVVIQAVLEHVLDPQRCVAEIARVLKKDGLIYAETPFMQQVHMRQYDFTRFTDLGHRYLFRGFAEIERGVCGGPGMALAWSWRYFLMSFSDTPLIAKMLDIFSRFTSFWWKYFDHYLVNKKGAYDAASGFYFLGRKQDVVLEGKALLGLYRGH